MGFPCSYCEKHCTTKYNLKRHIGRAHDSWVPSQKGAEETESENEESDEENETDSEEAANTCESSNSDGESSDCEDNNSYTYDEVQAILRYVLQKNE